MCLSTNKSKHRPSDQKFSKQRTESADRIKDELTILYSSRFHISCKRLRALFIARNHWGVRTDSGPIAEVVASLAWLARFLIEATGPVKNSLRGSVKIC